MKFLLEHALPRKLRYAKVYIQAGSASMFFSLDGATANWYASVGRKRAVAEMSDKEYSRLRVNLPAEEAVDDDGRTVVVRNSKGFEEEWTRPRWVLNRVRKTRK